MPRNDGGDLESLGSRGRGEKPKSARFHHQNPRKVQQVCFCSSIFVVLNGFWRFVFVVLEFGFSNHKMGEFSATNFQR